MKRLYWKPMVEFWFAILVLCLVCGVTGFLSWNRAIDIAADAGLDFVFVWFAVAVND